MSTMSSHSQLDLFDDSMYASGEDLLNLSSQQNVPNRPSPGKPQVDGFATQLTRLQEEQVLFLKRIDREKKRKEQLEANLDSIKQNLRTIRDKTNNGTITKVNDINNRKLIGRLEYQLQNSKTKLSTAHNGNHKLKLRVEDLRREKMLQLQILGDLQKETSAARRRSKFCAKEVQNINEKKHKVKALISGIKQKMIRDMEDFSNEIDKAKQAISSTQVSILNTIREKLQMTQIDAAADEPAALSPTTKSPPKSRGHTSSGATRPFSQGLGATSVSLAATQHASPNAASHHEQPASVSEAEAALRDTEFRAPLELLVALQQSEESIFALYHDTQSRHEEVEKMELENKHLEAQVQEQMKRLHVLEGNQEQVKLELEHNIQQLKAQMAKFDQDFAQNMDVLQTMRDPMLSLLKNVAIDEEALDQQLISTGITDRNILDFLAIIEQRIDELIQMVKAANHQPIRREDFMRALVAQAPGAAAGAGGAVGGGGGFTAPALPSMDTANDDDDDLLHPEDGNKGFSVQPLNVGVLKEIIMKKLQQKATLPNPTMPPINPLAMGGGHLSKQRQGQGASYASASQMSTSSLQSSH